MRPLSMMPLEIARNANEGKLMVISGMRDILGTMVYSKGDAMLCQGGCVWMNRGA